MPQIFEIGQYIVFFWSDESKPLEPVHVHIAVRRPTVNATKLWITSTGRVLLCHNNSGIPARDLRKLIRMIEANSEEIIQRWKEYFEEIRFFC